MAIKLLLGRHIFISAMIKITYYWKQSYKASSIVKILIVSMGLN